MLNFAVETARDAGNVLVQKLGTAKVSTKGDINLVTEADIAAENLIIDRIRSYYPQHGILAEESGEATLVGGKRLPGKLAQSAARPKGPRQIAACRPRVPPVRRRKGCS